MTRKANVTETRFYDCEKEISSVCKHLRVVPIVRNVIVKKADGRFNALFQTAVAVVYMSELQKLDFTHIFSCLGRTQTQTSSSAFANSVNCILRKRTRSRDLKEEWE